jgi:hypothetical protein
MTTPILLLDEWEQGQAQPHATVNEALRWLECFAQLSVLEIATAPTGSPDTDGDRYIVATGGTGDFAGQDAKVALYLGTAWAFREAPPGSIAWVQDEGAHRVYMPTNSPPSWDLL